MPAVEKPGQYVVQWCHPTKTGWLTTTYARHDTPEEARTEMLAEEAKRFRYDQPAPVAYRIAIVKGDGVYEPL